MNPPYTYRGVDADPVIDIQVAQVIRWAESTFRRCTAAVQPPRVGDGLDEAHYNVLDIFGKRLGIDDVKFK